MATYFSQCLHDSLDDIHQSSTVEEFYQHFEAIRDLVSYTQPWLTEAYFASRFIYGLREDIQRYVINFRPVTVIDVVHLANVYEYSISQEYDRDDVVVINSENLVHHKTDKFGTITSEGFIEGDILPIKNMQQLGIASELDMKDTELQSASAEEDGVYQLSVESEESTLEYDASLPIWDVELGESTNEKMVDWPWWDVPLEKCASMEAWLEIQDIQVGEQITEAAKTNALADQDKVTEGDEPRDDILAVQPFKHQHYIFHWEPGPFSVESERRTYRGLEPAIEITTWSVNMAIVCIVHAGVCRSTDLIADELFWVTVSSKSVLEGPHGVTIGSGVIFTLCFARQKDVSIVAARSYCTAVVELIPGRPPDIDLDCNIHKLEPVSIWEAFSERFYHMEALLPIAGPLTYNLDAILAGITQDNSLMHLVWSTLHVQKHLVLLNFYFKCCKGTMEGDSNLSDKEDLFYNDSAQWCLLLESDMICYHSSVQHQAWGSLVLWIVSNTYITHRSRLVLIYTRAVVDMKQVMLLFQCVIRFKRQLSNKVKSEFDRKIASRSAYSESAMLWLIAWTIPSLLWSYFSGLNCDSYRECVRMFRFIIHSLDRYRKRRRSTVFNPQSFQIFFLSDQQILSIKDALDVRIHLVGSSSMIIHGFLFVDIVTYLLQCDTGRFSAIISCHINETRAVNRSSLNYTIIQCGCLEQSGQLVVSRFMINYLLLTNGFKLYSVKAQFWLHMSLSVVEGSTDGGSISWSGYCEYVFFSDGFLWCIAWPLSDNGIQQPLAASLCSSMLNQQVLGSYLFHFYDFQEHPYTLLFRLHGYLIFTLETVVLQVMHLSYSDAVRHNHRLRSLQLIVWSPAFVVLLKFMMGTYCGFPPKCIRGAGQLLHLLDCLELILGEDQRCGMKCEDFSWVKVSCYTLGVLDISGAKRLWITRLHVLYTVTLSILVFMTPDRCIQPHMSDQLHSFTSTTQWALNEKLYHLIVIAWSETTFHLRDQHIYTLSVQHLGQGSLLQPAALQIPRSSSVFYPRTCGEAAGLTLAAGYFYALLLIEDGTLLIFLWLTAYICFGFQCYCGICFLYPRGYGSYFLSALLVGYVIVETQHLTPEISIQKSFSLQAVGIIISGITFFTLGWVMLCLKVRLVCEYQPVERIIERIVLVFSPKVSLFPSIVYLDVGSWVDGEQNLVIDGSTFGIVDDTYIQVLDCRITDITHIQWVHLLSILLSVIQLWRIALMITEHSCLFLTALEDKVIL